MSLKTLNLHDACALPHKNTLRNQQSSFFFCLDDSIGLSILTEQLSTHWSGFPSTARPPSQSYKSEAAEKAYKYECSLEGWLSH